MWYDRGMQDGHDNPLLEIGLEVPFDRIRPEHVRPAAETLVARARQALDEIAAHPAPERWEDVLGRLDVATEALEVAMTVVGHLESVATTPELRVAYNAVKPEVSAFYAGIPLHEGLWRALKRYAETEDAKALAGARRRYLQKTVEDFQRHGADLDPAGKARLEAISRELAELTARYAQNVLDATAAYELIVEDEAKLAGLPPSAREAARESAAAKGKAGWRFTLQAPSLIPVLTYLEDPGIREQLWRAHNTKAAEGELANPPVATRILELRREQATLLGYPSFADLVLEDRMAKRGETARAFVEDLTRRTRPAFERENRELAEFRRAQGAEGEMMPWDVGYWAEKQRQALYEFDEEELRPYFALEACLDGLFRITERLYGVTIQKNERLPTWHPDVRCFDIAEKNGAFLGSFYLDVFPRDSKRGGAWMNGLISGVLSADGVSPHLGLIAANVTPPVGGRPALLTHDEVSTLFHEFGHLLHHLLSRVEVRSLAGTNVAWDFVELPSQIMENWCWEREALDLFARHHDSGAPIPEELFGKMRRARTYRAANAMMRQLGFASVDLALHMDWDPSDTSRTGPGVVAYAREIMQRYAPARYPDDYAFIASFSHLFASAVGYAAGYYSYKWAEVLDADAFTRFTSEGVFSPAVGDAFRRLILERGDTEDPMALYERFMGRKPALEPLLERSGLLEPEAAA